MRIHVVCKFDFPLKYSRSLGEIADSTQTCGRNGEANCAVSARPRVELSGGREGVRKGRQENEAGAGWDAAISDGEIQY